MLFRVIGVDPGSKSWDFFGIANKEIILDTSIPSKELIEDPSKALKIIKSVDNIDLLVAPSGFGLPLKKVSEITEEDVFLILLKFGGREKNKLIGLGEILRLIRAEKIPSVVIPGIKHLPTIPRYRKINKIDMGTADKLCTAVTGIRDQVERLDISPNNSNFIMIEIGYGFTSILAIENGQVIDGIGGSNIMGLRACGSLDGELAYLLKKINKKVIYSGGLSFIAGQLNLSLNEIISRAKRDSQTNLALNAYLSELIKAILSISSSYSNKNKIMEIMLAGRSSELQYLKEIIHDRLEDLYPVRLMRSFGKTSKHAAQGAAFIANGLLGGEFEPIINNLKIKEAKGTILDDIYIPFDKNDYGVI
ncbi:MAG: DUF1464 domain-containing protein [Candidatus Lokiarchaeota archaeon]|nr:DUF1464 domain-containing protein [Candidatus Lokiarchaeota archaeon]